MDIQALAHAVELTRQGAVDSLRFAKGDLLKAFQVLNVSSCIGYEQKGVTKCLLICIGIDIH